MSDFDFDFDPAKLREQAKQQEQAKAITSTIGSLGDVLASGQSFGNFYTGKMNPQSTIGSKVADTMNGMQVDPIEQQAKLYQGYKQSQEAKSLRDDDVLRTRKRDPNSNESKALKALAPRWGIQATPEMSAFDIEQMIDPKKMMETEAKSRVDFNNDMAKLRFSKNADLEKFQAEQGIRSAEKREEKSKLSEKQLGDVSQYDDSITALQDMLNSAKPEYVGAMDGRLPDWSRGGDEAAFRSRVGRYSDAYRKLITGAGASAQELKRLENRLPGTTDTYENFTAKAKGLLAETQKAKARHLSNLQYAGKNVADYQSPAASSDAPTKAIAKREISPSTGKVRITYADGTTEIVNPNMSAAR
jgi:hypothetical protein